MSIDDANSEKHGILEHCMVKLRTLLRAAEAATAACDELCWQCGEVAVGASHEFGIHETVGTLTSSHNAPCCILEMLAH
jgi:hypothetical protein